ncbi:hypothetical protein [Sphingopyxis sp.]|jgi:hypothetical protein|uniref:hypothetical protein n=1 Tax=Sphingopyxis sp. TaxID=1908224 RepID=UPI002583EEEB|nr:hypothetical protein [Sphingopyxis sp.]
MRHALIPAAFAAALASSSAVAQSAPDVEDLVGARAAGGETQLLSRGYVSRHSTVVRDQRFTFWWNERTQRCISVSTVDGRYAAILGVPQANCSDSPGINEPAEHSTAPHAAEASDPQSLVLVCYGSGNRPTVNSQPNYVWNDSSHKWEWRNQVTSGTEGFNSDVQIELYGDHGRIHLGPKLVPPIHSGGDHGWWNLENLVVGRDQITASYRLNGMNKPKVTVDRRTGLITVKAMTDFSGRCDVGNWGNGQRRF